MNLPWIDVVIVASCAVISALLTKTVMTGFRPNHLVFSLIWLVLFPVALIVAFIFVKPEVQVWRARTLATAMIEEEPLFAVASSRHSEIEDEIRDVMTNALRRGLSGSDARRVTFAQCSGMLLGYFDPYLRQAGDNEVVDYAAQLLRVVRMIEDESGVRCYWLLTGSPAPDGSTFAGVPDAEISDLSRRMAKVIQSAISRPREPLSSEGIEAYLAELKRRLAVRLGAESLDQLGILDRPAGNDADRERDCRMLIGLFDEAFQMPSEHRSNALRALLLTW